MSRISFMNIDVLGHIYIHDMIIYYDRPLVFLGVNDSENYFIASCTDIEDSYERWILLPISKSKSIKALSGNIKAYDLFKNPEGGFLWNVKLDKDLHGNANKILPSELLDDDLPDRDVIYDVYESSYLPEKEEKDIVKTAVDEGRDIIDISLEKEDSHNHEIDAEILGDIIKENQKLLNLISDLRNEKNKEFKLKNRLSVSGFYAASFGIRMKSYNLVDLEERATKSELQKNIDVLIDILRSNGDVNLIKQTFGNINPNIANTYKNLLKALNRGKLGINLSYGSPNKLHGEISLSTKDIEQSLENIESQIEKIESKFLVEGTLVSISLTDNKFKILSEDDKLIKGKIDKDIHIKEYKLPKYIKADIKQIKKIEKLGNNEKVDYILEKLEYLNTDKKKDIKM